MQQTDICVIALVQVFLLVLAAYAAFRDARTRKLNLTAEAVAEVTRGDKSMNAVYTVYGAAIASCLVLIDNAPGLEGHKVALIVIDFLCVTYVFFFSTWFRNSVFFPLMQQVRKD